MNFLKRLNALFTKNQLDFELYPILVIYIIGLILGAFNHEPWFDESQAWLLARDTNPAELFYTYLRYESSPGLWHLLLMPLAKLGLPILSMQIISIIFASMGIYVFLRFAPFPKIIKYVFPFSLYPFFQYAVVSRPYVIFPLLLFLIARTYGKDQPAHIYYYTFLLSLLALLSLHGALVATGILLVYLWTLKGVWPTLSKELRRKNLVALSSFAILIILVAMIVWPPADILFAGQSTQSFINISIETFFSHTIILLSDVFISNISYAGNGIEPLLSFLSIIMVFLLIYYSFRFFKSTGKLILFAIPFLLLLPIYHLNYIAPWHQGILFLLWIFVWWVSSESPSGTTVNLNKRPITVIVSIILIIQIFWAFSSIRFDLNNDYSGSKKMADYIKRNKIETKKIFAKRDGCIGILPYFQKNIYANYNQGTPPSFWLWSTKVDLRDTPEDIQRIQPDYIIVFFKYSNPKSKLHSLPSYRLLQVFPGQIYWKGNSWLNSSFAIYQKNQSASFPLAPAEIGDMFSSWSDNN